MLGRISGSKRDEETGEWGRVHNEELNDLYSSPNIVRVIESRIIRWAGMYRAWGRGEAYTELWWGSLRERHHWGDTDVDGKIILILICRKWDVGIWTGLGWLRIGTGGGHL
jgi:hypothetical protein